MRKEITGPARQCANVELWPCDLLLMLGLNSKIWERWVRVQTELKGFHEETWATSSGSSYSAVVTQLQTLNLDMALFLSWQDFTSSFTFLAASTVGRCQVTHAFLTAVGQTVLNLIWLSGMFLWLWDWVCGLENCRGHWGNAKRSKIKQRNSLTSLRHISQFNESKHAGKFS